METEPTIYVNRTPEGGMRVARTRVSLDSVVRAYWQGRVAESIVLDFPSLSLEQVYGALAYYLAHRTDIDRYLAAQDQRWDRVRRQSEERNGPLLQRLRAGRGSTTAPGANR